MKKFRLTLLKTEYRYPVEMKRKDGSSKFAFVTFLMRNDNYLPGALMFAYGLRKKGTGADLVCMVSGNISNSARYALGMLFDHVIDINEIYIPSVRKHERQDIPYVFTRFNALRLGKDGDLGFDYEKIVVADADLLPLRFYDHLFTLDTPAGIINECKGNFLESDENKKYTVPGNLYENGLWKWHHVYGAICPHGHLIPKYITDRVASDPKNLGINSSIFVLTPDFREYEALIGSVQKPENRELICNKLRWPEMQYATMFWSGKWTNVDVRFSGINGYPDISLLCGIHYAGSKPWNVRGRKSIERVGKFPDYQLWYRTFLDMTCCKYRELQKINKIKYLTHDFEMVINH